MNKKLFALSCILVSGFAAGKTDVSVNEDELAIPKMVARVFHTNNKSFLSKPIIGGVITRQEEDDCEDVVYWVKQILTIPPNVRNCLMFKVAGEVLEQGANFRCAMAIPKDLDNRIKDEVQKN